MNITVKHQANASRFELYVDDELAGYMDYVRRGDEWEVPYTRVLERFGGRGLGHELVVGALRAIADEGGSVIPTCPFVPRVMTEHPEFIELVPAAQRSRYGL